MIRYLAALAFLLLSAPSLAAPLITGANVPEGSFGKPQVASALIADFAVTNGIDRLRVAYKANYVMADPARLTRWQGFVNSALARGLIVMTEPHDYGQSDASSAPGNVAAYVRMLDTVNAPYKGKPNVWISLDNEPGGKWTAATWWPFMRATYDGLRALGYTNKIILPGKGSNGAGGFPKSDNARLYVKLFKGEPNVAQDVHAYGDSDASGTSAGTCRKGYPGAVHGTLSWAEANRMHIVIGEGGIGLNCTGTLDKMLAEIRARPTYLDGFFWWSLSKGIPYPGLYGLIGKDGKPSPILVQIRKLEQQ